MSRAYIPTSLRMRVLKQSVGWRFLIEDPFACVVFHRSGYYRTNKDARAAAREQKARLKGVLP